MYLLKLPSSVYYHRSPVPITLRERGFPNEIRLSLLTKERTVALERNIQITLIVKQSFRQAIHDDTLNFEEIKAVLYKKISDYRTKHFLNVPQETNVKRYTALSKPRLSLFNAQHSLADFLKKKKSDGVTALTIHQLAQRISHCIEFIETQKKPYNKDSLEAYIEHLKLDRCSAKTNKEYFSAVKQFFAWCHGQHLIKLNPCVELNPRFKSRKHASEERDRWKATELDRLLNSVEYQSKSEDFRYITELQVYQGLRPNEACQLTISNIQQEDDIWFLDITDIGDKQHLKNVHSVRQIPVHPELIANGFLDFVQVKANQKAQCSPLFNYEPYGEDHDWSKHYRVEFGKLQDKLGMKARSRPTPYGFRHTFIDVLQNAEVAEALVSQFVGHANQSITFGRYGKRLKLKKLFKAVTAFKLPRVKGGEDEKAQ
ncbi:TPA: tyrosine-type recombinase/integrase [Vibrio parahaemolyticus]|nr:tyrosine-type recombinase/integrase [Vibrio parahaemolyticus]